MSRQLEAAAEDRDKKRHLAIVKAVEFELLGALNGEGNHLQGFSVRLDDWEVLITLRATRQGVPSVSFVGAEDLGGCLIKCVREAKRDKLHWKEDKFAR
jgi:hypothetical protein